MLQMLQKNVLVCVGNECERYNDTDSQKHESSCPLLELMPLMWDLTGDLHSRGGKVSSAGIIIREHKEDLNSLRLLG